MSRYDSGPLPSMRCVCGHWDTEHAAFVSTIRPGRTRTTCDHCDCRYWMTPEDKAEFDRHRSRATAPVWGAMSEADADDVADSDGRLAPKGLR